MTHAAQSATFGRAISSLRAWYTAPAPVPGSLWSGSWMFAVLAVLMMMLALAETPEPRLQQLNERWHLTLLVLWLAIGSHLIRWAYGKAEEFKRQVLVLAAVPSAVPSAPALKRVVADHELDVRSRRVIRLQAPFVFGGLALVALVDAPWCWRLSWVVTVGATLYYGAFGLWGAWVATHTVSEVAMEACRTERMRLFHADRLAGLGFAVKYADVATILLLTGATALPLAMYLGQQCVRMGSAMGSALGLLAAALTAVWVIFTLVSGLRGRCAVARAIEQFRTPLLNELADRKRTLIEQKGDKADFDLLDLREKAAVRLRSGVFSGVGGWKDLISLAISLSAIVESLQSWHAAVDTLF
jgi:hypothetical protein